MNKPSEIEFIGEIGVNHNGDLKLARELVHAIADSGASTVKLQLFRPEALVTKETRLAAYQIKNGYELTEWLLVAMFILIIILAPLMAWWESDLVEKK